VDSIQQVVFTDIHIFTEPAVSRFALRIDQVFLRACDELFAALFLVGLTMSITAQQRGQAREIVNVKGDIYRARNNNYFSLFMVTPEGIILADPINAAFATWMKEQFAERFHVPVRYVIYSHSHWDHIEGGAVFADTARFVAHENVAKNMDGRIPQMPAICSTEITTAF
jgi:glyoxylase-like metal-dependent hydrolase (beta-lactamase superfamily II)